MNVRACPCRPLPQMLQASPMLNDAQILAVGLDRAWSLLRRSPHATGQQNPRTGQEQIMTSMESVRALEQHRGLYSGARLRLNTIAPAVR